MGILFRYWILPAKLRRLSPITIFALLVPAIFFAYYSSLYSTRTLRENDPGILYLFRQLFMLQYYLLPSFLFTLGLIAGAVAIAPERQKQTWESLLLTRMRLTDVIHAKTLVILTQCLLLTLPLYTPLFIAYSHHWSQMLVIQDYADHSFYFGSQHTDKVRAALYLLWTSASMFGHLLAGTLLGMAISACCRRTQTALVLCGSIIVGMTGLYVMITNHYYPSPYDEHLYAHLFWWPLDPFLAHNYLPNSWWPEKWELKLIAEMVWSVILPMVCYAVTLWGCRLGREKRA